VITLGVDLASQPERTAACALEWANGRARVLDIACGQDDDALLARIRGADKAGLDVPFGWPDAFVEAVARFHAGGAWPEASVRALRFRETDHVVAADRRGAGRVVETYPAAALRLWGFASTGYKRRAGRPSLTRLLAALQRRTAEWLTLDAAARRLCGRSDDALDALVAALVARAAALGLCAPPPPEHAAAAAREGWIALPAPGSLDRLGGATPAGGSASGTARRTSRTSTRRRP
jgi:hypothetical protein